MWTCSTCGMQNFDSYEACPACGTPMPGGGVGNQSGTPSGQGLRRYPLVDEVSAVIPDSVSEPDICRSPKAQGVLVLEEARSKRRIEITGSGGFLGREGDFDNDLFSDKVSRLHLDVRQTETGWDVTHQGINPTYLFTRDQRIKLPVGVPYPVHDAETLRLADMTFRIFFKEDTAPADGQSASEPACVIDIDHQSAQVAPRGEYAVEGWFVDCPGGCGSSFLVSDSAARLSECPRCVDDFDKRKIKRVAPVRDIRDRRVVIDVR